MNIKAFQNSPSGQLVRTSSDYWAYVPNPLPPDIQWTSGMVAALSEADRALGELAGLGRSLPNPHLLIRPFLHREAVLSSRIEGTRATLSDLYAYEVAQLQLFELPSDVHEVHNYVQALEYGLDRLQTLPLSLRLIREIHARLLEGVRGELQTPGEFRRSQNWIGSPGCTLNDADYVPPPMDEMHKALHALEGFLYAPSELPPLIRLGMIHYQFEAIHPFLDGNGRIGRLLMTLLLCGWDLLPEPLLYLSAYFEAHRQDYYNLLLGVSQNGTWQQWLSFFLQGVSAQSQDAMVRARRLQTLRKDYRARFQTARAAARLLQVVDLLFSRPVFTVPELSDALQVNYPTAMRYVNRLVEAEVLREITGQVRNRVYQADGILQALEESFS
jgi:Fic family protein